MAVACIRNANAGLTSLGEIKEGLGGSTNAKCTIVNFQLPLPPTDECAFAVASRCSITTGRLHIYFAFI